MTEKLHTTPFTSVCVAAGRARGWWWWTVARALWSSSMLLWWPYTTHRSCQFEMHKNHAIQYVCIELRARTHPSQTQYLNQYLADALQFTSDTK